MCFRKRPLCCPDGWGVLCGWRPPLWPLLRQKGLCDHQAFSPRLFFCCNETRALQIQSIVCFFILSMDLAKAVEGAFWFSPRGPRFAVPGVGAAVSIWPVRNKGEAGGKRVFRFDESCGVRSLVCFRCHGKLVLALSRIQSVVTNARFTFPS